MKSIVGGLGAGLCYLTLLLFYVGGVLTLWSMWDIAGLLIGIFIFPLAMIISFISIFASVWTFIGYIIWFGLIYLMCYYGDN